MSDLIRLSLTTLNAPDAIALARFYAEITGGVAKGDEHWALVEGPNGDIGFQQVDDYRPPTWPDGEVVAKGGRWKDVVDTDSARGSPPPIAGNRGAAVVIGRANLCATSDHMCERNETTHLMAEDRAGLDG